MSYSTPQPSVRDILTSALKTVTRAWADCAEAVDSQGRQVYADYTTPVKYSLCGAIIAHSPTYGDYERVRDTFRSKLGISIHDINKQGQQAVIAACERVLEAL